MPKGDQVLVKTFLNQPIMRSVLRENHDKIVICREAFLRVLGEGKDHEFRGTAIPRNKVFKWDKALFDEMLKFDNQIENAPQQLTELWKKAMPY
jgi:hypothetical protein